MSYQNVLLRFSPKSIFRQKNEGAHSNILISGVYLNGLRNRLLPGRYRALGCLTLPSQSL